jgi:hypothetical protein
MAATFLSLHIEPRLALALCSKREREQRFRAREWSGRGGEWCEEVRGSGWGFI